MSNLSFIFSEVARNIACGKSELEIRSCPDQGVGRCSDFNAYADDFPCRVSIENFSKSTRLLVLMESPHVQEFQGDPGPAKGRTGALIRKHLRYLTGLEFFVNFEVILINAVQYQCSLGCATKKYRDRVFLEYWNQAGKENFTRRLESIYRPEDVIINCCTKGNGSVALRDVVQNSIPDNMMPVIRKTHPSSWWCRSNRNYEF
jgi:hypothetical protein